MQHSNTVVGLAALLLIDACGSSDTKSAAGDNGGGSGTASGGAGAGGSTSAGSAGLSGSNTVGVGGSGDSGGSAGGAGTNGGSAGGAGTSGGTGGTVGTCTPPSDVFSPIEKLSQTGCVDPADPRKPIARAVSYELNSPLWSDSADKARAFVLPSGAKIHVRNCVLNAGDCPSGAADDGRWDFPVGTVMIKIFMFDGKLVETRLFMHVNAANWVGYSYEWDKLQTEATIVSPDRVSVMFDTGTRTVPWHYPSQQDCLTCHNQAGGSTLGPETAQMNRMVDGVNQIDHFASLGVFETAPAKPYRAALVTPYRGQLGSPPPGATKEQEARSYLHANCGFCHRPGGAFALFDLRYDTRLMDTQICNVNVNKGAIPSAPGKTLILSPGHAADSVIWLRMNELDPDSGRMPQIGSYAVDGDGLGVVGDWINSLTVADCAR